MDPREALRSVRAWLSPQPDPPRVGASPDVGALLGARYELVKRLGTGAGAAVFRAHDRLLAVDVAVKVLLRDGIYAHATAGVEGDLRAEARRSLALTHPNIVRVYTYEKDQTWEYLVMELVEGEDLARYRARQPNHRVIPPEAVQIGIACLDALAFAHEHGLLHNDVKPGNVLIDHQGSVRLCDFGLARLASVEVQRASVGGSPVYMAPERIRGRTGDARSDLYSLGATLYAITSGAPPFGGDDGRAMAGHLEEDLPIHDDVPAPLDRILRRAMAKQPEERFASAREMRDALAQYAEQYSVESTLELAVSDGLTPVMQPPRSESPPTRQLGPATPRPVRVRVDPHPLSHPEPPFDATPDAPTRPSVAPPPLAATPAAPVRAAPAPATPAPEAPATPTGVRLYEPTVTMRPKVDGAAWIAPVTLDHVGKHLEVHGFYLETSPVTNARFKAYLDATHDTPPSHWLGTKVPAHKADHPVVGVDLGQARRFAAWAGRRLPTEAEWIAALRGAQGRPFPWGKDCATQSCQCPRAGVGDTAPVGARPGNATPEGVLDLLGNVWEWVENDPRLPPPEPGRGVALGGSFRHACLDPGTPPRSEIDATKAYLYLGFRCAIDGSAT